MTLAEKLTAARAALVTTKDAITALTTKESLDEAEIAQLEELSQRAEQQGKDLAVLERAEKALAAGAVPMDGATPPAQQQHLPAVIQHSGGGAIARLGPRSLSVQQRKPFDLIVRSALIAYEAHLTHEAHDAIIARRYPGNQEVAEVSRLLSHGVVSKAATPPAMTNVAGWAAELVREGYNAFMDALAVESIIPQLPLARFEFDGYGKIHIPARASTYPTDPNLAAAFRAEGAPIRVGRTQLTSKVMTPKSMGVIGTFTKELLRRSTPNIEEAIRNWMLQDTALALDTAFLDAVAGTAIRPAGIRNGLAAGDTAASSGATGDKILADLSARLKAMSGKGLGRRPVWVMNTANAWQVKLATTPTGLPQFPGAQQGTLVGIPLVESTNVPIDVVFLVDAAEIAFAGGAPSFEGTDVATIHEESGDPNTDEVTGATVLPIATGAAGAAVVATPVRSLFQTHSAAVKALWEVDWTVMRAGAVQTITGVAWV